MVITLGQQYNVGEKPTVILYCTLTLIAMQGHQQKGRQTNTSSNNIKTNPIQSLLKRAQQRTMMMRIFIIQVRCILHINRSGLNHSQLIVVVDSHIQRIVLATEETTVTQQVSHRPIKRQSRLWSQRGTKVNGSHHGDNPLLRPTGIQIATKSYAALQAMAPTNIKTVHHTSLLHSRATSIDSECCRLPTTSVLSKKPEKLRSNQF